MEVVGLNEQTAKEAIGQVLDDLKSGRAEYDGTLIWQVCSDCANARSIPAAPTLDYHGASVPCFTAPEDWD
jgi:hypothetical protein